MQTQEIVGNTTLGTQNELNKDEWKGIGIKKAKSVNKMKKGNKLNYVAGVTEDVEMLTSEGFKKISDIKYYKDGCTMEGLYLATFNIKKQIIEYEYIKSLNICNYSGDSMKVGHGEISYITLPHHNNIVFRNGQIITEKTENLKSMDKFVLPIFPIKYKENYGVGENIAELIGWIIAEGHYQKHNGRFYGIEITQNEGKKQKRIENLLNTLQIPYKKHYRKLYTDNISHIFWLKSCPIVDWMYYKFPIKQLNKFSVSLPINEPKRMFESLILGDGHIRKKDKRICFTQKMTSFDTRNFFQILCFRLGYNCIGVKDIHINKRKNTCIRNSSGKVISKMGYSGLIYCPSIKNDGWVCRSGINMFLTGKNKTRKLPYNE